jgi:hypothetical protein
MAVAGIEITAEMAELRQLQQDIGRLFSLDDKARILKAALTKAIEPAFLALKQTTPLGPTGNLRRAVAKKVIAYTRDGAAVAVLGFRRAGLARSESAAGGTVRSGPDRAFHQWWLEEGTQARQVSTLSNKPYGRKGHLRRVKGRPAVEVRPHIVQKGQGGYIASSFNRLGPFKMIRTDDGRVQTEPGYPNAFFRKSKTPITIPAMNPGGSGEPPLKTAWARTQPTVAEILQRELRLSLEQALDTLSQRSSGTIGT